MLKQAIAGILLVASGIALSWIFLKIKYEGIVYIVEPNEWILAAEMIMSAFILIYGFIRFCDALRKARDGNKHD